jgi:hypothetical protein
MIGAGMGKIISIYTGWRGENDEIFSIPCHISGKFFLSRP